MNKKAIITVLGIQKDAKNKDTIELVTEGEFLKKGSNFYIHYDESKISGMEGTSTTLKVEPERVVMFRSGNNATKMIFERGKRHPATYVTPYGDIEIEVLSKKLRVNMEEIGGEIYINYLLNINEEVMSTNEIHITVREVN